jgi:hypothetical protein
MLFHQSKSGNQFFCRNFIFISQDVDFFVRYLEYLQTCSSMSYQILTGGSSSRERSFVFENVVAVVATEFEMKKKSSGCRTISPAALASGGIGT